MKRRLSTDEKSDIPLVWYDCDPGHDDAAALMILLHAHRNESIKLIGLSSVHGNQTEDKTRHNIYRVLALCGMEAAGIPVVGGSKSPLVRVSRACPEIHGQSGLDFHPTDDFPAWPGALDEAATTQRQKAEAASGANGGLARIADLIGAAGRPVNLIATGPLTNVALLLRTFPNLSIAGLYIMGGAIGQGNITAAAEFNILCDPEAARICLSPGDPVAARRLPPTVLVPLEVTHTLIVTKNWYAELASEFDQVVPCSSGSQRWLHRRAVLGLLTFFETTYRDYFGFVEGPPLHDPAAVLALLRPDFFDYHQAHVHVELGDGASAGRTVVLTTDQHRATHTDTEAAKHTIRVAKSCNVPAVMGFMKNVLVDLNKSLS